MNKPKTPGLTPDLVIIDDLLSLESDIKANYDEYCGSCDQSPTVGSSEMCGACFFGEADCIDPDNW